MEEEEAILALLVLIEDLEGDDKFRDLLTLSGRKGSDVEPSVAALFSLPSQSAFQYGIFSTVDKMMHL